MQNNAGIYTCTNNCELQILMYTCTTLKNTFIIVPVLYVYTCILV